MDRRSLEHRRRVREPYETDDAFVRVRSDTSYSLLYHFLGSVESLESNPVVFNKSRTTGGSFNVYALEQIGSPVSFGQ